MPSPAEDRHRQEDACKYGSVWVAEVCVCACGAHPNRVDAIAEVRIARREDGQRHLIKDRLALVARPIEAERQPAGREVIREPVGDREGDEEEPEDQGDEDARPAALAVRARPQLAGDVAAAAKGEEARKLVGVVGLAASPLVVRKVLHAGRVGSGGDVRRRRAERADAQLDLLALVAREPRTHVVGVLDAGALDLQHLHARAQAGSVRGRAGYDEENARGRRRRTALADVSAARG